MLPSSARPGISGEFGNKTQISNQNAFRRRIKAFLFGLWPFTFALLDIHVARV
jgi:hypothetical protein